MPEKMTLYQVVLAIAWSDGRAGPCVHILEGFQIEGGMNIVDYG